MRTVDTLTLPEAEIRAQQMIDEVRDVRSEVEQVYGDLVSKNYPAAQDGERYEDGGKKPEERSPHRTK